SRTCFGQCGRPGSVGYDRSYGQSTCAVLVVNQIGIGRSATVNCSIGYGIICRTCEKQPPRRQSQHVASTNIEASGRSIINFQGVGGAAAGQSRGSTCGNTGINRVGSGRSIQSCVTTV